MPLVIQQRIEIIPDKSLTVDNIRCPSYNVIRISNLRSDDGSRNRTDVRANSAAGRPFSQIWTINLTWHKTQARFGDMVHLA
jgi:hypothetical protein